MKSKNYLFLIFILVLTVAFLQSFVLFKEHFSPVKELESKLFFLNQETEREKLKTVLVQKQFLDFQYSIAGEHKGSEGKTGLSLPTYQSLSEVIRVPASDLQMETTSQMLMAKANDAFLKKDYIKAEETFQKIIDDFPTSPLVIKAHFLLAESYFLMGKRDSCLDVIQIMLKQYPENEMTGYILLRMAQLFEDRNRLAEAAEVYRIIIKNFAYNESLRNQSQLLLNKLTLANSSSSFANNSSVNGGNNNNNNSNRHTTSNSPKGHSSSNSGSNSGNDKNSMFIEGAHETP